MYSSLLICTVCGNMWELFGFGTSWLKPLIYKGFNHRVLFILFKFGCLLTIFVNKVSTRLSNSIYKWKFI